MRKWMLVAAVCAASGVVGAQERPIRRISIPALVTAAAFAPDGKTVVAWDLAGWSTWDVQTGRQTGREPVFGQVCGRVPALPRTEDGRTVGVSCGGRLVFFDTASRQTLGEWKLEKHETPVIFTAAPDGALAAVVLAGALQEVQIADRSGAKSTAIVRGPQEIEQLSVAPGAALLGTGTVDGVRIWKLPAGEDMQKIPGVSSHVFSPDARTVAVGRRAGVGLYTTDGQLVRELEGPSTQIRFSADGRRLAGLSNQKVVVWDVASGAARLVLSADEFVSAALAPDASHVVTVSRETRGESTGSTVAIWRLPPIE